MKKNSKLKKVTSCKIIAFSGIFIFSIAMFLFVINAITAMDFVYAWVLFGIMIFAFVLFLIGSILYIKFDFERIKEYFRKIRN